MVYLISSALLILLEIIFWVIWNKKAVYKVDFAKPVILPIFYAAAVTVFGKWTLGFFLGFVGMTLLLFFLTLAMQFKND